MPSQAFDTAVWIPPTPPQVGNAIRVKSINPIVSEWFPIANGGATGPAGPAGVPGPPGADGAPGPPSFPDAAADGTSYVRRNNAWTNILDAGTF